MKAVVVRSFGLPEHLTAEELPTRSGVRGRCSSTLSERAPHATAAGHLKPVAGEWFALANAAGAHAAIDGREMIGKTLLVS